MNDSVPEVTGAAEPPMISEWLAVTQSMIDRFGAVTQDPDPMHQNPQWAQRNSPFGCTIAYGFLTVSLLTHLFYSAAKGGEGHDRKAFTVLNYGFNKLRLVSPVRAGARIRGHFTRLGEGGRTRAGHLIQKLACRIEIENEAVPALVAEWLSVAVPAPQASTTAGPGLSAR
jgi:acyl dehydratase